MKLRTLCLALPLAYLVGVAGSRALDTTGGSEGTRNAAAIDPLPPVASATGGADEPPPAEDGPSLAGLSDMNVTTPEEVREVLRLTRGASSKDSAELTAAALEGDDPLVAGNAALALGRLGEFASDTELLALLADERMRVRQDAVRACGLDGDDAALPHLQQALAAGDETLRPLVLEALGRIGGPEARAILEEVAHDRAASETDRVFARTALERMRS